MQPVIRDGELPEGGVREFTLPDGESAFVLRYGGSLFAYLNQCPHTGIELNWRPDSFLSDEGKAIQCATHGALFRPDDGYCFFGPCARESLEPLAVRVREGVVWAGYRDSGEAGT